MAELQAQIEKIVADAAAQITALFKAEAAGLLRAFGGGGRVEPPLGRRPATGKAASTSTARRKGAKRSATEIESTAKKLVAFIAKNPGLRIEQINKELGTKTKDVALPLKKLIAAKAIRTKGAKRATTYYPTKK